MKKYFSIMVFVVSVAALLAGCGGGGGGSAPSSSANMLAAAGGVGTTGFGGDGGTFYIQSSGTVTVSASGAVDASFTSAVSEPTPSFGPVPFVVSGGTSTVFLDANAVAGKLCMNSTDIDGKLYIASTTGAICSSSTDSVVTGLTVPAGATLVLTDPTTTAFAGYGTLVVSHDVEVTGTIITTATDGIEIDPRILFIKNTGKISASATTLDTNAGAIYVGYFLTKTGEGIYNHGTIEAKGLGTGSGGLIDLEAGDVIVNYGTMDTSGGSSAAGTGGNGTFAIGNPSIDIFVDLGNFYSSGTLRMNGGRGGLNGGEAGFARVQTAFTNNDNGKNGDIVISGTWEAMGGEGAGGNGGGNGHLSFTTYAMGTVAVNATMLVSGGKGGVGFIGGDAGGIDIASENVGTVEVTTPGTIQVSGRFDVRGGDGGVDGGAGGFLRLLADGANTSFKGCDVKLLGFPEITMNGGDGASGGSGNADAFVINTFTPQSPDVISGSTDTVNHPAGAVINEANILAKGGAATGASGAGGTGGYVEMIANASFVGIPLGANATTVVKNSGSINISGGNGGDTGGSATPASLTGHSLYFEAYRVTNTGKLVANGGNGTTAGGNGGNITIWSKTLTTIANPADMYVDGGTGAAPGAAGTKVITH